MKSNRWIYALLFGGIFLTELAIALFVRDAFIRPYVGDMLVAVMICSFLRIFIPNGAKLLPLYVFIFSVTVETAQYFDIVELLGLEENRLISILIGRTFSFADILCYAIGCLVFFAIEQLIKHREHV